jgi:hypothetical protein
MCNCGDDLCGNMRFQKRSYPKLKVVDAGAKGFGILAAESISEGQFVIEYVGAQSSFIRPFLVFQHSCSSLRYFPVYF